MQHYVRPPGGATKIEVKLNCKYIILFRVEIKLVLQTNQYIYRNEHIP